MAILYAQRLSYEFCWLTGQNIAGCPQIGLKVKVACPSQESQSRHVRIGIREEHVFKTKFCGILSRAEGIFLCIGTGYNVTYVGTYTRLGAWEGAFLLHS